MFKSRKKCKCVPCKPRSRPTRLGNNFIARATFRLPFVCRAVHCELFIGKPNNFWQANWFRNRT